MSAPPAAGSPGGAIARGAAWMVLMRFVVRGLGIVSTVILARLLTPADFGVIALASALWGLMETATAFGVESALISARHPEPADYHTAWTVNLARGVLIAVVLASAAGLAAEFFAQPQIETVLYCFALASLLRGFENIGVVNFLKGLDFRREFVFFVANKLTAFTVTVAVAIVVRSYWAMVFGTLAGVIVAVGLSYAMSPVRPRLSLERWRALFHFSKWMTLFTVGRFGSERADVFVLGRVSAAPALGAYNLAFEIAMLPVTELAMPLARAVFPGLATLAGDPVERRRMFMRVLELTLFVCVPASVGLMLVAPVMVPVVLGQQWLEVVPIMQALAWLGITRVVLSTAMPGFLAARRPDVPARIVGVTLLLRVTLYALAFDQFGMMGLAIGVVVTDAVQSIFLLISLSRIGLLDIRELALAVWRVPLASAVMALTVSAWPEDATPSPGVLLASLVALGGLVYAASVLSLWWASGRPPSAEARMLGFCAKVLRRNS